MFGAGPQAQMPPVMQRMAAGPAPQPEAGLPPALQRLAEQAQQLAALPPPQALQMATMLAQQSQGAEQQFWAQTVQRLQATLQQGRGGGQAQGNVVSQTLGGPYGQ